MHSFLNPGGRTQHVFDQTSELKGSPNEMAYFLLIFVYIVGFSVVTVIIMCCACGNYDETETTQCDPPWVPGITRRDACAMPFYPIFFLLPAILWPLVLALGILFVIVAGLCVALSSATSCCGIPLPRGKEEAQGDGGAPRDLEMGAVGPSEDGGSHGGGGDDESELPPSYASLAPHEDGGGETGGLLGQGAK